MSDLVPPEKPTVEIGPLRPTSEPKNAPVNPGLKPPWRVGESGNPSGRPPLFSAIQRASTPIRSSAVAYRAGEITASITYDMVAALMILEVRTPLPLRGWW